jgi:hypothetical protein
MATIKITQLPTNSLSANTSNTVFVVVDTNTGITSKVTETQIANNLYANNVLNVGGRPQLIPNVIAQFASTDPLWLDVTNQNFHANGSSDFVAVSNLSETTFENYIDMGINNSNYHDETYSSMMASDGYLYTSGVTGNSHSGNLIIGTATTNAYIKIIAGGTTTSDVVGTISSLKFNLLKPVDVIGNVSVTGLYNFSDATTQSTAASPILYTQLSFDKANSAGVYANTGINNAASASLYANTANTWLQSNYIANTSGVMTKGDFKANGNLYLTKNIVYTQNNITGNTNTITIDIANTSILKFTSNDTTTISLSNYITGKVSEVWIVNANTISKSVSHGCLSNNSTTGTSSFNISSGKCAYLKYFCILGDPANTFVSINYS